MKHFALAAAFVLLLSGLAQAAEVPLKLEDEKDKYSYGVGYQIGRDFRMSKIPINPEAVQQGILDGLGGQKSMMTDEERNAALQGMQQQFNVAREAAMKELGAKNQEASQKFMTENATKEGIKVLPSGLQYKVLAEGKGNMPKPDDSVTVNYRGTLVNGVEFDSTAKRGQPATLQVGQVIKGWQEALLLMKEGAKWQLFVPPALAYGERGAGQVIPPNSALIFEVELLSIAPKPAAK